MKYKPVGNARISISIIKPSLLCLECCSAITSSPLLLKTRIVTPDPLTPLMAMEIMLHDGWTLGVEGGAFLEILNPGENAYGSGWFISVSFLKFMPAYAELHPQR